MKKAFLALVVLVGLVVVAEFFIAKFWPDTKAGEYAVIGRDATVEWYNITKDFWVEQWHRFRPEEPEPQVAEEPPAPEPEEEPEEEAKPEETAKSAEPPKPVVDLSKPWKGLEPENWYCGKKLDESSFDGKIVMVYVFSESDEDSVALLPRIENVWSAYKTKPLVVLGSHRGGKSAKAENLIKKAKVTFPVYEGAGRTQEPSAGGRYPIVYVVNDTGRMIYRGRSDLEATEAIVTAIPNVGRSSAARNGAKTGKRRKGGR